MTATRTAIPISRPYIGVEELSAVQGPLLDGWVVQGPRVAEFESSFERFSGAEHAVATSSCTTALHLGILGLGAGPGDEVLVPAFTWISSANVVEYVGATPVFCDIELDSFNIDPAAAQAAVTDRTVGIIPVHLFGRPAEMGKLSELAHRHGLWVLEDAACGFGTRYRGAHAGTLGDAGCFSFHPRKSITTGEGGMLTTANAELAELARSLRDHGASRSDHARHAQPGSFRMADYERVGFNYRMTDIQGALGCAQMDRAEWILGERARQAALYDAALADLDWLRTPAVGPDETHGWQAYVCLYGAASPSLGELQALHAQLLELMQALEREGIATRPGTHAPVRSAVYRERYALRDEAFPRAVLAEALSLALPLYPGLSDAELERVVDALHRYGG